MSGERPKTALDAIWAALEETDQALLAHQQGDKKLADLRRLRAELLQDAARHLPSKEPSSEPAPSAEESLADGAEAPAVIHDNTEHAISCGCDHHEHEHRPAAAAARKGACNHTPHSSGTASRDRSAHGRARLVAALLLFTLVIFAGWQAFRVLPLAIAASGHSHGEAEQRYAEPFNPMQLAFMRTTLNRVTGYLAGFAGWSEEWEAAPGRVSGLGVLTASAEQEAEPPSAPPVRDDDEVRPPTRQTETAQAVHASNVVQTPAVVEAVEAENDSVPQAVTDRYQFVDQGLAWLVANLEDWNQTGGVRATIEETRIALQDPHDPFIQLIARHRLVLESPTFSSQYPAVYNAFVHLTAAHDLAFGSSSLTPDVVYRGLVSDLNMARVKLDQGEPIPEETQQGLLALVILKDRVAAIESFERALVAARGRNINTLTAEGG